MKEIKSNPQVYTTQEGVKEIKSNPRVYTTQEGLKKIKSNPQVYTTQEGIEKIKNNPQLYTTQEDLKKIQSNPQVYTTQEGIEEVKLTLLYPDSLAPPTSARGVSNPTTTKVTMPATTTQTTAVPVSRLDVQITPRPDAKVFRRCRPAIYVDLCSMGQPVSPITCLRHRVGRLRITSN